MKKVIVMVLSVAATFCGWAATETVDGITWTYNVSNGKASFDGTYSFNSSKYIPCVSPYTSGFVSIPSEIGGYYVTDIGGYAFDKCNLIEDIKIPDGIVSIGYYAFRDCKSLKRVSIPNSVTSIGDYAFSGCTNVTDATVPGWQCTIPFSSVTNLIISDGTLCISNSAFSGCSAIKSVTIPDGVKNIGNYAFYGCSSIESITIPSSVTNVDYYAFKDCKNLTNAVVMGAGLYHSTYSYGSSPFKGCSNIVSFSTMDTCAYMLYGCDRMKDVILIDGIKEVKAHTFHSCKWLTEIDIPNSVTNIGDWAFRGCDSLSSITISDGVIKIGSDSFSGCSSLSSVSMSDSIKNIGSSAFYGCSSLVDIIGLPQCVCTSKFSKVFTDAYQTITNIVIADGVTRIAADCFNGCLGLKKIVIPASVSVIYDNAFKDCVSLEEIVFLGDAPDVGSGIFTGTPRTMKITVKEGSIGWNGGVSTALPEVWPVGDSTARGISYYDDSPDIAALVPVITPEDGSIFADTCEVSISCAAEGAAIYYRTDGKTPKISDNYLYRGPFTISDTSKIVAVAVKEGFENAYATATLTKRTVTLAEAAGASDLAFMTDGDAKWMPVGDKTAEGGVSARSGAIGDDGMSWLEVTVSGRGTLSFKQKVSCEDDPLAADWDHLEVVVDGEEWYELRIDGETDWVDGQIEFTDNDTHTVCWVYAKDDCDSGGKDCAWISGVTWVPADVTVDIGEGKSVVVPVEWIDSYADIVAAAGGDKAAALQRTAANGRKVWECYALGLDPADPSDDFRITRFWMEDGVPKFEFNHTTDGSGNSFLPYVKPLGKAQLSDKWRHVPEGGNVAFRFFTVEVVPPGCESSIVDEEDLGGVQLWENGPYWAECNVGATKPEEYGYYFWWGDTVGYTNTASGWISVKDGTSISFFYSSGTAASTYHKDNATLLSAGYIDSTGNLAPAHDAATAHLGSPWRMPTSAEIDALINNCTITWTHRNGVDGLLVTGKGDYANKSIFLPAAGTGNQMVLVAPGSYICCYSSTPDSKYSSRAWCLYSDLNSRKFKHGCHDRYYGQSVRPVRDFAK